MKIALIGYGKMGKTIEEIALSRGHEIVSRIDINRPDSIDSPEFASADVVIEFTAPSVAYDNYLKCFERNKAVVSGTTGWLDKLPDVVARCEGGRQTFFYSSNFSLGVNIFFEINRKLAAIMDGFDNYAASISEVHHIHKLDAPSGTAISLANDLISNVKRLDKWALKETIWPGSPEKNTSAAEPIPASALPITAYRQDEFPGIHAIRYESDVDSIEISHSAKSRRGFAYGVVLAAEFTNGKKGYLQMKDMLGF